MPVSASETERGQDAGSPHIGPYSGDRGHRVGTVAAVESASIPLIQDTGLPDRAGARLRAAHVLPIAGPPIEDGAVAVAGGAIVCVGPAAWVARAAPALPEIHLERAVLMPGLVDAHCHLEWSLTGGLAPPGLGFGGWLGALLRLAPLMRPEDHQAAAALGALQCLRSGTTTVADSGPTGAAAGALRETGLRGVVHLEAFGRLAGAEARAAAARHAERVAALDGGGHVTIGVAPHAPYTVGPQLWEALAVHPGLRDRPWTTHLAESPDETRLLRDGDGPLAAVFEARGTRAGAWPGAGGPVRRLHDAGALRPGLVAAHCAQLEPGDEALLAAAGVAVAHCPVSNAALACGRAPLERLRAAGVTMGLGTDSPASDGDYDLRHEARACRAAHEGHLDLDPGALLDLATRGGAEALGLGDLVGTLEPGKRADLVAVVPDSPTGDPCRDALESGRVTFVMVDGEVILDGGGPVRVDAEAIHTRARTVRSRLTQP